MQSLIYKSLLKLKGLNIKSLRIYIWDVVIKEKPAINSLSLKFTMAFCNIKP